MSLQLSVVILNYNVRYFLELCLKSVQAAIADFEAEIIVVDNASTDDSCQMVKALFPEVILIENNENLGFSKGNNLGVQNAKGRYVCILNPDTVVAEDTFKILMDFAENTPKMGIVGCRLLDGKGQFLPESKRNVPTPLVSIKKILGSSKDYYANHLSEKETGKVAVLVGAFMLLRRSLYNDAKGFDEDYFMYGEDMDFSYRVQKMGYDNYYNPTTSAIHFKGESTIKNKTYANRFNGAMRIFFKKHFKPNVVYDVFIGLGIKIIVLLPKKSTNSKPLVSGYELLSDGPIEPLRSKLGNKLRLYSPENREKRAVQLIFDNNVLNFKEIILHMDGLSKVQGMTFRILPKNARFIIGSDSSTGRGEVLCF